MPTTNGADGATNGSLFGRWRGMRHGLALAAGLSLLLHGLVLGLLWHPADASDRLQARPLLVDLRTATRDDAGPTDPLLTMPPDPPVPVTETPPAPPAAQVAAAPTTASAPPPPVPAASSAPPAAASRDAGQARPARDQARLPRLAAPASLDGVRIASYSIPVRISVAADGQVADVRWGRTEAGPDLLLPLDRVLRGLRFAPALGPDGDAVAAQLQVRLCFNDAGALITPMPDCWLLDRPEGLIPPGATR